MNERKTSDVGRVQTMCVAPHTSLSVCITYRFRFRRPFPHLFYFPSLSLSLCWRKPRHQLKQLSVPSFSIVAHTFMHDVRTGPPPPDGPELSISLSLSLFFLFLFFSYTYVCIYCTYCDYHATLNKYLHQIPGRRC